MTQASKPRNEFGDLGQRLVRLGQALQEGSTTVGDLTRLATACGIKLHMRVVADTEGASNAHAR